MTWIADLNKSLFWTTFSNFKLLVLKSLLLNNCSSLLFLGQRRGGGLLDSLAVDPGGWKTPKGFMASSDSQKSIFRDALLVILKILRIILRNNPIFSSTTWPLRLHPDLKRRVSRHLLGRLAFVRVTVFRGCQDQGDSKGINLPSVTTTVLFVPSFLLVWHGSWAQHSVGISGRICLSCNKIILIFTTERVLPTVFEKSHAHLLVWSLESVAAVCGVLLREDYAHVRRRIRVLPRLLAREPFLLRLVTPAVLLSYRSRTTSVSNHWNSSLIWILLW